MERQIWDRMVVMMGKLEGTEGGNCDQNVIYERRINIKNTHIDLIICMHVCMYMCLHLSICVWVMGMQVLRQTYLLYLLGTVCWLSTRTEFHNCLITYTHFSLAFLAKCLLKNNHRCRFTSFTLWGLRMQL